MVIFNFPVKFSIPILFFKTSYPFSTFHLIAYNFFNSSLVAIFLGRLVNNVSVFPLLNFRFTTLSFSVPI